MPQKHDIGYQKRIKGRKVNKPLTSNESAHAAARNLYRDRPEISFRGMGNPR